MRSVGVRSSTSLSPKGGLLGAACCSAPALMFPLPTSADAEARTAGRGTARRAQNESSRINAWPPGPLHPAEHRAGRAPRQVHAARADVALQRVHAALQHRDQVGLQVGRQPRRRAVEQLGGHPAGRAAAPSTPRRRARPRREQGGLTVARVRTPPQSKPARPAQHTRCQKAVTAVQHMSLSCELPCYIGRA